MGPREERQYVYKGLVRQESESILNADETVSSEETDEIPF